MFCHNYEVWHLFSYTIYHCFTNRSSQEICEPWVSQTLQWHVVNYSWNVHDHFTGIVNRSNLCGYERYTLPCWISVVQRHCYILITRTERRWSHMKWELFLALASSWYRISLNLSMVDRPVYARSEIPSVAVNSRLGRNVRFIYQYQKLGMLVRCQSSYCFKRLLQNFTVHWLTQNMQWHF